MKRALKILGLVILLIVLSVGGVLAATFMGRRAVQDGQTFDAVRADLAYGRFKLFYAYVSHVNRILGEARDWDSDSHLAQLTWSPAEQLRLQGFVRHDLVGVEQQRLRMLRDRGKHLLKGEGGKCIVVVEQADPAPPGLPDAGVGGRGYSPVGLAQDRDDAVG